jgi:hypothetical protein
MALFGAGVAALVAFFLFMRLALPRADGSLALIARDERVASAYSVFLVTLLIGAVALIFASLVG